ncbi:hypothetical protein D770_18620 [Flammeovirgaceae bacterium 311]|nr:hypothetical protein D770_18620 [Flammeovirgaceae bacterium 311]
MKKLLLTFVFVSFVCGFTMAQTEAGAKLIGGTGTLHISTEGNDLDPNFVILSPRFGFFLANNIAVGTAVPLMFSANSIITNTSLGITPFARLYIGSSPSRFLLEARAGYSYSIYNNKNTDANLTDSFTSYGVGIGYVNFINDRVGLEVLVSYDKADDDMITVDYSHYSGINLNLGLQIYLASRK